MKNQVTDARGPLTGYRVLEITTTGAGPFCARLLADFGADVVKIEDLVGDPIRQMGKTYKGKSMYGASIMRNKKLIAVDLRQKAGQDVIRRMVKRFDIVVENFKPGTLERWGLGYEQLRQIHPDLIMVRISGFGQTGPYSARPGYGIVAEAMSGLRRLTGDPAAPPGRVAIPLTDYITAVYGAYAAAMALLARKDGGRGQVIDTALYECAMSFLEPHIPAFEKTGWVANRVGSRLPDTAPNNLYPTADGEHIHIAALTDRLFEKLARAMKQPHLAQDGRFSTQPARVEHQDTLDGIIGGWTASKPLAEVEQELVDAEVPASRIYSVKDLFEDPHVRARGMLCDAPDEDLGAITLAGVVPKLSGTPGAIRWAGRDVGQDTRQVLQEDAGLSDAEIELLIRDSVVSQRVHSYERQGVAADSAVAVMTKDFP